jgi:hypothetical protein
MGWAGHRAALALLAGLALAGGARAASAEPLLGVECHDPPPFHCAASGCTLAELGNRGTAVDPKTGRRFFLDYPCDWKPGDKVVFILSLHGAGSIGQWQRHYFPAMDFKDKYRLVIATPTAATETPLRMWMGDADDQHLQNIADQVISAVGRRNIRSFWLAGHSQGGMTSNRIVCSPYFKDKVDGWLSLSGGRLGPAELNPQFFRGRSLPALPAGSGPPGGRPGVAVTPECDVNFIFETGEHEIQALPASSPWADKYACGLRVREPDVVDERPGWVDATVQPQNEPNPAWGLKARPGTAEVFVYPHCKGGRLVADVMRMDKGHTEGLEPNVTEKLIQLMVSAPGGKLRRE